MSSDKPPEPSPRRRRKPASEPPPAPDASEPPSEATPADTLAQTSEAILDPAECLADVMLEALLSSPGLGLERVRASGAVVGVQVLGAEWLEPVRGAWTRMVSGETDTYNAETHQRYHRFPPGTYVFCAKEQPRTGRDHHLNTLFAEVVGCGQAAVGFSPDLSWLPPDFVAALDYKVTQTAATPAMVSNAAGRLSGSRASSDLTAEEAASVTPRLLRLSRRPGQDADAFLLKLKTQIGREAMVTSAQVGKSRSFREEPTLDRLNGMDEAVAWGFRLRDDLVSLQRGDISWMDVDKGLLLSGPTGTGKTSFARALAATCGVPFIAGSYGSWMANGSGHQGDLLKAMRKAFSEAKAKAPAILFIDEIDGFADRARARHHPEWHTEVVNTLLAEIDGVEDREGVVVVGACNQPDKLDPALVRSGRLDRHIRIELPDAAALAAILREHLAGELQGDDLSAVGLLLLGATGADIERLVRGARRRARVAGRPLAVCDVVAEVGGGQEPDPAYLMLSAVHEAGHAVAAVALGLGIDGVTLRSPDGSGGRTMVRRGSALVTLEDVQNRLVIMLSGRAAEEVILGRITSGAGGPSGCDLQRATELALRCIVQFGLDGDRGLTWTPLPDRETKLAGMLAQDVRLAKLVNHRLASSYEKARELVGKHRKAVRTVANRLLETGALGPGELGTLLGIPCA